MPGLRHTSVTSPPAAHGLRFAFDVRTPLNISDVTFHPSRRGRGHDLFATAAGVSEVMFIDLQSGNGVL